jgi:hypothetical protein
MLVFAFWGLLRSLDYTIQSLENNVLKRFPGALIFCHTYTTEDKYTNARAQEFNLTLNCNPAKLRPTYFESDDLTETRAKLQFGQYHTQPDPWNNGYATLDNFVCAMYSKLRVTQMIQAQNVNPSHVIFLRPDVLFLEPFTHENLKLSSPTTWVIPNFHLMNGFNDRFCVASPQNYVAYGTVFHVLLPYSRVLPLHSETMYGSYAKMRRINVQYIVFPFIRIRATGKIEVRDHELWAQAQSKQVKMRQQVRRHMGGRRIY